MAPNSSWGHARVWTALAVLKAHCTQAVCGPSPSRLPLWISQHRPGLSILDLLLTAVWPGAGLSVFSFLENQI